MLPRLHGRVLSLQQRRRLGDRKPYRLVGPDGDVSVPHRGDRALPASSAPTISRTKSPAYRCRLAAGSGGPDRRRNPPRAHRARTADWSRWAPCSRSISPRAASRACASGSTAPTDCDEERSWWVLRLESIGYVLVSAMALLVLAFVVVLGPLIFQGRRGLCAVARAARSALQFCAFRRRRRRARRRADHPAHVAAGRTADARHDVAGIAGDDGAVAGLRHRLRALSRRVRLHLRELLCRTGVGDDRAGVSLLQCLDFCFRRRAQRRDRARAFAAASLRETSVRRRGR